jgi:alkanesulfonate monooxygenase SsuD/methylene tetrahydromethanopterin reductase-like flavin-dependent oxidoreductase (luciferase family)
MAAIAGRHGDGFNTQAMHPKLADLARVARDEHTASGRDPSTFMLTVFAGLDDRWLDPTSRTRQNLERLDVARLILLTEPPYDGQEIRQAGRMLTAPR